jgi:serine protease AprX
VRANSLVFAIPIIVGISLPLGPLSILAEPAAGQEEPAPPDPIWQRLGLPESPTPESGRGVGTVLMDDDGLHPALRHLGERLKHVTVAQDMSVSLVEPHKSDKDREDAEYTHGFRALLQMASAPFRVRDLTYGGLAPGATYFVVPYLVTQSGEGTDRRTRWDPRLDRALGWVVENREQWNIRVILLSYFVSRHGGGR